MRGMRNIFLIAVLPVALLLPLQAFAEDTYCDWTLRRDGVLMYIDKPLCALEGNAQNGRRLVTDRANGNCLACHLMPIPEEDFHGRIGPPLHGVGARYTTAELRVRLVDEKLVNADTIMPGFYRYPQNNNRLADSYYGKTMLSAQEVEDIVAYLATLKDSNL